MPDMNGVQAPSTTSGEPKFKIEQEQILLNNDELRSRNREQLIEKLERVIQEKNASIAKLEQREQHLEGALKKRNAEFLTLEEKLKQFEEKTQTFEQLHQLQVQTFEKTIRDCQTENERLCDHIADLTRALAERSSLDELNKEKILTFDRIVADTQLWRQKLDSYKETIEEREETIANLKKEINDLHRKKQTNGDFEDNSLQVQISVLQNTIQDRDDEIENLKETLRRVRDTLRPGQLSHESRWKSCSEDIGRGRASSQKKRSISPPTRQSSSALDVDYLTKKLHSLTDRLTHVQQLLVKRDEQILTLKKVHDKRWLRLKHLQKQYNSVKDELQSYNDDEMLQRNCANDFFYRKAIRKTRNGCSVCNDHRWKKQTGRKILKQEDDDHVWNEVTKLRRETARLTNENLSLNEKIDLQDVEINEQTIVIDELRNEIRRLNDHKDETIQSIPLPISSNNEQNQLIEKLDKRLYELETERTNLIFDQERLKTNYDLCIAEKQHLTEQRTQTNSELKKSKLRILALQDEIHKLKRNNKSDLIPILTIKRRIIKKKPKKPISSKSCLEMLLDQNGTLIDDLQNESFVSNKPRQRSYRICNHLNESSLIKRKRRPSISSTISKTRYVALKRSVVPIRKPSTSLSIQKTPPTRISTLNKRIEQLETHLARSREDNEHLNQRLTTTLSRINILKTTNQKLITECDKMKSNPFQQDSVTIDNSMSIDNLYERLKNTSFDAAQQRKLNKSLQVNNELLNKNLQSLTEKLTHSERDIASKRVLIENYKTRLNEMETNLSRSNDKDTTQNDDDRVKALTETMEKLRISIESYKNRLQVITREKHELDLRHTQLNDEHQKLKTRFEDAQTKVRSADQQLRQLRLNNEKLTEELQTSRRSSDQQLLALNTKSQDSLRKITLELDRVLRRLDDYEKFINGLFHEMIQRGNQATDHLKRAREQQKHRESLTMILPGYDTAMNTASRILNLTQDDLDEIMSVTDDSFQVNPKEQHGDKNEKIRQKITKLLTSQEECASKLLKIFAKKLDELQTTDHELSIIKHT